MKTKLLIVLILVFLNGCTDAEIAQYNAIGKKHKVLMYNGGVLVKEWISSGFVTSMNNSDGWQFMDSKTNKLVRVGGDVIIIELD